MGLKAVETNSCGEKTATTENLFGETEMWI